MDKLRFLIEDGVILHEKIQTSVIDFILKRADGEYEMAINSLEGKTARQLAYYYGALIPLLMNWSGNSKSDMDKIMKAELLDPEVFKFQGKEILVLPSLSELSKVKMSRFIDNVVEFMDANELNPPII